MSLPNMPDINIDIDSAVNIVIASIGLQELSLAHILNAEGEKIQSFLGTLDGQTVRKNVSIDELMVLNSAVIDTINSVTYSEMLLMAKLNSLKELLKTRETMGFSYPVQITWVDSDNEWDTRPPQIAINLYQNGGFYAQAVVNSSLNSYAFRNLPVLDEAGQPYVYSVTQESITGYETTVNGNSITNTIISVDITIISFNIDSSTEMVREIIPVPYGSDITIVARVQAGYNRVPPISHDFVNVRTPVSHTFNYRFYE